MFPNAQLWRLNPKVKSNNKQGSRKHRRIKMPSAAPVLSPPPNVHAWIEYKAGNKAQLRQPREKNLQKWRWWHLRRELRNLQLWKSICLPKNLQQLCLLTKNLQQLCLSTKNLQQICLSTKNLQQLCLQKNLQTLPTSSYGKEKGQCACQQ